jgi:hypothetical protein
MRPEFYLAGITTVERHFAKDKRAYIASKRFLVPVPEISAVCHDPL